MDAAKIQLSEFERVQMLEFVGESVLVYGVPETRVSFESQFIVDNKEYKHGITNNVIFFSRSAPLLSSLFCPDSYTSLSHDSFDQL